MKQIFILVTFIYFVLDCSGDPWITIWIYDNDTILNEWVQVYDSDTHTHKCIHESKNYEIRMSSLLYGDYFFYGPSGYEPHNNAFISKLCSMDTVMVEIRKISSGEIMKVTFFNMMCGRSIKINLDFISGEYFVELNKDKFKRYFPNADFVTIDKIYDLWWLKCSSEVLTMTTAIHKRITVLGKNRLYRRYSKSYRESGHLEVCRGKCLR